MSDFVRDVLLRNPEGAAYICTLPNVRGEGTPERHVSTRDLERIQKFVEKWDQQGRGLFYCVSTIVEHKPRRKENYCATILLHGDVDFKDITETPEEAIRAIEALPYPPSRIHRSGNGLHLIWILTQALRDAARVEASLKRIVEVVAGDPSVAHVAALMRMPGSHNTKSGAWTEVEVVRSTDGMQYDLLKLELWLSAQQPVLTRKARESDVNPFTRAANVLSFKAPVDADERLAAMTHGGAGENGVHATELSVTASLLSAGSDPDVVVSKVLEAVRKIGDASWNWEQEERTLRGMCDDWLKKHPRDVVSNKKTVNDKSPDVVSLADKRLEKSAEGKQAKAKAHVVLGTGVLASLEERKEKLLFCDGMAWLYQEGLWRQMKPDEWKIWSSLQVEAGCNKLKVTSTQKLVSETRAWLERQGELHADDADWDEHGKIATLSGLIDYRTLTVETLTPEHMATHCVDCEFVPGSEAPQWQGMLRDMDLDEATRSTIQEILGAALVDNKPRGLMRALVLVGGSNTGKSNLLRVMSSILSDEPITTPIEMLENPHGLQDFLRRAPWVLDEAFDQGRWHFSATVKALLSGDYVGVNVKNGPMVTHRFRSAVFWGSNAPPQFKEASRAMENRMIVVRCNKAFDSKNPVGAALEAERKGYSSPAELILAEEKEGVLCWALAGLQRARARGHFVITRDMEEALHEMRLDSNMAAGFFESCVALDPYSMVSAPDLYAAFAAWWRETRDNVVPSPKSFGRAMSSLGNPKFVVDNHELRYRKIRQVAGVKLNDDGMDYWQAAFNMTAVRGDTSRVASGPGDVCTPIPGEWSQKLVIQEMRRAHGI